MRKTILILLSLLMLCGAFAPLSAYAEEAEDPQQTALESSATVYDWFYGDTGIKGKAVSGTKITLKLGKKSYKTKTNAKGWYKFSKLPLRKIGTKYRIDFKYGSGNLTYNGKIESYNLELKVKRHYGYKTAVKGSYLYPNKGDVIVVKIGKKTYKKKVTKTKKKLNFTVNVAKSKHGSKIKVTIKNKFNQTMATYSDKVYFARGISKGITMSQVKHIPGWEYPEKVIHSADMTIWHYDDDGDGYYDSMVAFDEKDRVVDWEYEE